MNRASLRPAQMAALLIVSCAFLWTAVQHAGVYAGDWYVTAILIGLACVVLAFHRDADRIAWLPRWGGAAAFALGAYIVLQVLPLPPILLRALDPARAALMDAVMRVVPGSGWTSIAVDQPGAVLWSSTLFAAAALFFVVRSSASALRDRAWMALLPLVAVALLEATLGLLQLAAGAPWANGTFNSRDHYCCFLELAVPLLAAAGLVAISGIQADHDFTLRRAALTCAAWCLCLVLLTAIFFSLSRAGACSALIGLAILAAFSLSPLVPSRRARLALSTVLGVAILLALFAFTPSALLKRLFETGSADSATRLAFWRESLPIIGHYPAFGVGLMGFEPTFLHYQEVLPAKRVDFAHNDYLQYLIELGVAGFALLAATLTAVLWTPVKAAFTSPDRACRTWLTGCFAAFVELALHSAVDFNLYVPANVLAFAWIAGFASALAFNRQCRREERRG